MVGALGVPVGVVEVAGAEVVGVRVLVGDVVWVRVGEGVVVAGPELGADGGALGELDAGGADDVGAGVPGRLGECGDPVPDPPDGAGRTRK